MKGEDSQVSSNGFVPFVPRVVSRRNPGREKREDRAIVADLEQPPAGDGAADEAQAVAAVLEAAPAPMEAPRRSVPAESVAGTCEERYAALIRERAIELAGAACAQALHAAIARNPLFVARFVDDAIEAAGRSSARRVRLSPADAAACGGRIAVDIIADDTMARGEVAVECANGTVGATIDRRAELLVRAIADR